MTFQEMLAKMINDRVDEKLREALETMSALNMDDGDSTIQASQMVGVELGETVPTTAKVIKINSKDRRRVRRVGYHALTTKANGYDGKTIKTILGNVNDEIKQAYQLIKVQPGITCRELAKKLGATEKVTENDVYRLRTLSLVESRPLAQ